MGPVAEMLVAQLAAFFVVYARIGTAIIMMPAIGGQQVPARVKIFLSMAVTFVATPMAGVSISVGNPLLLAPLIAAEVTVGLFFATAWRMILAALHIFGAKFGFFAGLSNVMAPNDGITEGGSSVSGLMQMATLAVILLTDTHHIMLEGIISSYQLIPAGAPMLSDMAQQLVRISANAFWLAMMIGAPFMVFSVLTNLALGLANKVMPSMQVFFVAGPALILIGFLILAYAAPSAIDLIRAEIADWSLNPVR